MQEFYANQKKTFEINPRHPVVRELLRRVKSGETNEKVTDTALLLFETATLRSGFTLNDQVGFAERVEQVYSPWFSRMICVWYISLKIIRMFSDSSAND